MEAKTSGMYSAAPFIRVAGLSKRYVQRAPFSRRKFAIDALLHVDLDVQRGSVTAIVGESGSGKSTLAACLAMHEKPDHGQIWFNGIELSACSRHQLAALRPNIQLVFQDSAGALNPRLSAARIIAEPLEIQGRERGQRLQARVHQLMEKVGLSPEWANRRPLEFSGGQRQRLAIARAIALNPACLILDESLSGLDLSTQAQILNLILEIRATHTLTCIVISHDLGLVGQVADEIVVMHRGKIVERGEAERVLRSPQDACTRALVDSASLVETAFHTARAGGVR